MTNPPSAPSPAEIADLLAWTRRLTHAGATADAAERAAYLAAKADLLARIADAHADDHPGCTTQAQAIAAQATALLPIKDTT
jgi:hypothetical protein